MTEIEREELREIATAIMSAEQNIEVVISMLGREEAMKTHLYRALTAIKRVQLRWKTMYEGADVRKE